jgi:ADP-ribose pyrophosphatase YjhB (NUDIX family)
MIPSSLYNKITAIMPIASVEAIIVKDNAILFLKRTNSPAKGEWWFPGGRIRKGETFAEALRREVKEETGLAVDIIKFVGVYNRIFTDRHDITIVFLCNCFDDEVTLNNEHSEYGFFKPPKDIHPYLLQAIKESGWLLQR